MGEWGEGEGGRETEEFFHCDVYTTCWFDTCINDKKSFSFKNKMRVVSLLQNHHHEGSDRKSFKTLAVCIQAGLLGMCSQMCVPAETQTNQATLNLYLQGLVGHTKDSKESLNFFPKST